MKELRSLLRTEIGLNPSEIERFIEKLVIKHVPPKQELIQVGAVARGIYFIESGLMRTYHLMDGKEITTYFACDNQFISTYSSFIEQKPSFETLETIAQSQVYELTHTSLMELYQESSKFEKLGRILAERNY